MKYKKILIATLLLLTILTIGAVSASDSSDLSDLSSSDVDVIDDDEDIGDEDYDDIDDESGNDEEIEEDPYVFSDVDAASIYYTENNTEIAYLKDLPSSAGGTFLIYEGEFLIGNKTVVNGHANFIASELAFVSGIKGDHDLMAIYDNGIDTYQKSIYVSFVDYKIIPPSKDVYFGEDAVFTIILPEDVNGYIEAYEDEEFIGSGEVVDGVGIITLTDMPLGSHEIEFILTGSYYDFGEFSLLVVSPKKITVPSKAYVGVDNLFSIALPSDAKGLLTVEVKNLKTGKFTTLEIKYSKGKVVMPATKLTTAGSYAITDFSIEDNEYGEYYYVDLPTYMEGAVFAKFNVVYPKLTLTKVKVQKSAKKALTLTATLGKVNGKYLKGKQIVFKFKGKTYKANTNAKGVAKVTIKTSVLKKLIVGKKITYQASYFKNTVKKTVTVSK